MENEKSNETNLPELSNIEFLNQAEEKEQVCLFKSVEDAKNIINNNRGYRSQTMSIAVVKDTDNTGFINLVSSLIDTYKKVVFVCSGKNFTDEDVLNISLKIPSRIYEVPLDIFGYHVSEYLLSDIGEKIDSSGKKLFGIKVPFNSCDYYTRYIFYKNMVIKIWSQDKGKYRYKSFFKILTNYSFRIVKVFNYDDGLKKQDVEFEITGCNGDTISILLSASDKSNLSSFRKNINQSGTFIDLMTNEDFSNILSQLYFGNNYETIYKYDRPGLIADKNIYLTANEVIELEN